MITEKDILRDLEHLKQLCKVGRTDFFILLSFGIRSSKEISLASDGSGFYVFNEIDGSEETLTTEQMNDVRYTNIGLAINNGAFWCEWYA